MKGRKSHNKGKKMSEEQKLKISKTRKEKFKSGAIAHPMSGRKRPDVTLRNQRKGNNNR